ncbi:MAG: hypothetical protein A3B86_01635 [Candidatus Yanofskybacteria bacterium RIFCSPHIGHO2_02_FULL_38_22b]|uniref:Uncharacterized protein n=1 Tax=Candidatus Yanofskybacteria bacterium RIFCSPHIGHO2_02_FULL_38_22b TaxID=1802673 RepID=A0A1F8F1U5_9BACT|nr:MAG: hypothetical protein A2816_00530 [Candidatus Yanofskybacteria bacterium RIFCSPHIGHO2_01_FULL_39_44]OGN07093.1 MAG: hypothetical protein A3B86_01635 [Candidatus Yanofskybacteria bacterium RIFCSPHIGHO2_02_FULL_38_22b]OGN19943.1 MAG: hypothetical protein A2910_00345 [Candidatus Yanofskybacteria bacterium RIFCSPLOWO2_01_FULL_39_28]
MEIKEKYQDNHITPTITHWVHHHRRLAKWLFKFLIASVASLLYYLRNQEKVIEKEEKSGRSG